MSPPQLRVQFSLRTLMLGVSAFALAAAVIARVGAAAGILSAAVLLFYLAVKRVIPRRARIYGTVVALCFAALPVLGAGNGVFSVPGTDWVLPTPEWSDSLSGVAKGFLEWPYSVSELPIVLISSVSSSFSNFAYFSGEGVAVIQPFVVFAFWSTIAILVGVSTIFRRDSSHDGGATNAPAVSPDEMLDGRCDDLSRP